MIVDAKTGTRIDEVVDRIYRISTPVPPAAFPGGFCFNQFLIEDDEPLLFHTGMKSLFPEVRAAIETVLPLARLRHIAFSHVEADECGALDLLLAAAPNASPVCGRVAATISLGDSSLRPARALADGENLKLGRREITWIDAAHLPHNWETGYPFERTTGTLFCGDLFTRGGHELPALSSDDLLEPAEAFRRAEPEMGLPPSYSLGPSTRPALEKLAGLQPTTLACMHASTWHGSAATAAAMLRGLGDRLLGHA